MPDPIPPLEPPTPPEEKTEAPTQEAVAAPEPEQPPTSAPAPAETTTTNSVDVAKWDKIKKLVEDEDKAGLEKLKLEGKPIVQEGVTKDEVKAQILSLAPEVRPGLILDYISKLK